MNTLTKNELHFLIETNSMMHPLQAHSEMIRDGWGINYPYNFIEENVIGIGNRKMTKKEFKKAYSNFRSYINSDIDHYWP